MNLEPASIADLQEIVHTAVSPLRASGGGSKPALSRLPPNNTDYTAVGMHKLSGIVAYDPSEYLFTALAGTPLREISAALHAHGQYLPFDPLLIQAGATLGGTVAANTAGSGRYRYGGVRDFILEVRWVNGAGKVVRGGSRVVKNAAGFDLPKFMVGSLGRYGILTELTFKVFPQPLAYTTLAFDYTNLEAGLTAGFKLMTRPFEVDALDLLPQNGGYWRWLVRLGGLPDALPDRMVRLQAFMDKESDILDPQAEAAMWQNMNELAWGQDGAHAGTAEHDTAVVKVPLTPRQIQQFEENLPATQRRYTAGGNIAWIATPDLNQLATHLRHHKLAGLVLSGPPHQLAQLDDPIIGLRRGLPLAQRIKKALDPHSKFGSLA